MIFVKQQQDSFNISNTSHDIKLFLSDFSSVSKLLETEKLDSQLAGGKHDHQQTEINVAMTTETGS